MNKKYKYIAPSIEVQYVVLEESIAASSAQVTGGEGPNSLHTPGVEVWGDELDGGTQQGDY